MSELLHKRHAKVKNGKGAECIAVISVAEEQAISNQDATEQEPIIRLRRRRRWGYDATSAWRCLEKGLRLSLEKDPSTVKLLWEDLESFVFQGHGAPHQGGRLIAEHSPANFPKF